MSGQPWSVELAVTPDLAQSLAAWSRSAAPHRTLHMFLEIVKRLKDTPRTGWINLDVSEPESIADHMYRMALICMFTNNPSLDVSRCIKIALVHDMAEALTGDITPDDGIPKEEKHRRELSTMEYLRDLLEPYHSDAAASIFELWNEYEDIASPEARFVKDVDKFELIEQTFSEEKRLGGTKDLSLFLGVRKAIKTEEVSAWADEVLAERQRYWDELAKSSSKKPVASPN